MVETIKLNTKKYNCSGEEVIDALKGSLWYDTYLLKKPLDNAFYEYQKITEDPERAKFEPFYEKGLKLYACELLDKRVINLWESLDRNRFFGSPINHLASRFKRFPPLIRGKPTHTLNITRIFLEYLSFLESSKRNHELDGVVGSPKNFESKYDEKNDEKRFSNLLYKIGNTFPYIKAPQEKRVKFIEFLKGIATNHLPKKYEGIITKIDNFVEIREEYMSKKELFDGELKKFDIY